MTTHKCGIAAAAAPAAITAGKYLISPITTLLDNGWYACSVSIRSGSGATWAPGLRTPARIRSRRSASIRRYSGSPEATAALIP